MKCRYDLNKTCTEECKDIDACAWMADKNRREKLAGNKKRKAVLPVDIPEKDRRIMQAIAKVEKEIKPGGSRKIKCPACGSEMLVSRSSYNRKIFAKCKKCDAKIIE